MNENTGAATLTKAGGAAGDASGSGQDKASERSFYDDLFRRRKRFDQFRDDIYQRMATLAWDRSGGGRALDLGCGSGTQAKCLAEAGFTVFAADLSIEGVKVARDTIRSGGFEANVMNADAERVPVRDASVDACVCGLLLHHFKSIEAVAAEVARIVRPGGVVVALDANAHNPPTWAFLNVVHRVKRLGWLTPNQRALRASEIREAFGPKGFEDFHFESVTSELRKDWLGDSMGARLNYYTRAALLAASNALLPQIARGNMLLSVFRRQSA